ncbi:hypothetical protein ACFW04_009778 [Cataglyphis niger]
MPTRCVAIGCRNTASPSGKTAAQMKFEKVMKITFHSFPSNPIRRAEWIRIMKLEDKNITTRSRLCSLHFKEKYIDRTSLVYVRLRENAIPHIFEKTFYDDVTTIKCERDTLPAQLDKNSVCDKETNTSPSLSQRLRKSTEKKETRISPERIWNMNSSNMEAIRQERWTEIKSLRKQIQALQKKVWQKHKKIVIMKTILDELKIDYLISD